MPVAQVNGQKLFYQDSGGTRPAVIFSHGLFMDHEMFAPQVAALSSRYRCIAWDERGHGRTAGDTLRRSPITTRRMIWLRSSHTSGSNAPCWQACRKADFCRCVVR